MKRNAVYTALLTIASLLIITAVLFTSLQFCMNQRDWYYKTYVKYNTDKQTMMSNEDMTEAIFRLVDYMEGRVDSIQLSVTEAGRVVEMYNRQEIDHMVDVRALYQAWRAVRTYGGILAVIIIAVCMATLQKGERIGMLCRGFLIAAAVFGAVLGGGGFQQLLDGVPSSFLRQRPLAYGLRHMPHDTHMPASAF